MNAQSPSASTTVVARELGLGERQVRATSSLLDGGATVPFIARYRKEATGALDEVAIAAVRDRLEQLRDLDQRRAAILASLEKLGLLSDELRAQVLAAETLSALEDVYLPHRPKRRSRATIARERGLEPLALALWAQDPAADPLRVAAGYVDVDGGVADRGAALAGARDIMAEWVAEDPAARAFARDLFARKGVVRSAVAKGREGAGAKYRDYFTWEERAAAAPSHRILAMLRGEREGFLTLHVAPPEDQALERLRRRFVRGASAASDQVRVAAEDGYRRLLAPSMETETRNALKARADGTAITVFADNLRNLLMAPPMGQRATLAIDPGFRSGCKVVCLDPQGKLLHAETLYLHLGDDRTAIEARRIESLVALHGVEAIAIGNGTAGRETEVVVRGLDLGYGVPVVMVNESGASVYSASAVAREEFPDHDLTVRGAVSIGRRLMDPLAELVKIEPKAMGVGQYQHDVDQTALGRRLHDVVTSCVNAVGVDVNTASGPLLAYVSGLGTRLAGAVVAYRDANGPFRSRGELRNVPRLGSKAFEQSAGFLRVRGGDNPLDASAVHPENYGVVEAMAASAGCHVSDLIRDASIRSGFDLGRFATAEVGLPTLTDIMAELARPGLDPRALFEPFSFAEGVERISDLAPGMKLPGLVTNVTAFGAFVDIGVHQDGLVHISQMADRYVSDPREVVAVSQRVMVTVLSVDIQRNRISLSLRE